MAGPSKIQWTSATWNPVTGCTKVSPGCDHCYAETFAERWRGVPGHPYEQGFDLKLWPERLEIPLHWRKPRLIFANSMSDLFHAKVPFEFMEQVWQTMAKTPQHTYQILTKRPDRMARFSRRLPLLPNVWLGTSIEDQERAIRAKHLLEARAAVRFVSAEPLLGPVNLADAFWTEEYPGLLLGGYSAHVRRQEIHWVIIGGESGPGARPMDLMWVQRLREQASAAGVRVFVKQLGTVWARENRASDHKGGLMDEWPAELRIREMPLALVGSASTPMESQAQLVAVPSTRTLQATSGVLVEPSGDESVAGSDSSPRHTKARAAAPQRPSSGIKESGPTAGSNGSEAAR